MQKIIFYYWKNKKIPKVPSFVKDFTYLKKNELGAT